MDCPGEKLLQDLRNTDGTYKQEGGNYVKGAYANAIRVEPIPVVGSDSLKNCDYTLKIVGADNDGTTAWIEIIYEVNGIKYIVVDKIFFSKFPEGRITI